MSFMMTWLLLYLLGSYLAPPWLSLLPSNCPASFTSFIYMNIYHSTYEKTDSVCLFLHLTESIIISVFQEIFSAHRGFKSFSYIYVIVFCSNALPISHLLFTQIVPFCLHTVCMCVKFRLYMWEKTGFAFLSLANLFYLMIQVPFIFMQMMSIDSFWMSKTHLCVCVCHWSTFPGECLGWFCLAIVNTAVGHGCASVSGLLSSTWYRWVSRSYGSSLHTSFCSDCSTGLHWHHQCSRGSSNPTHLLTRFCWQEFSWWYTFRPEWNGI